MREFQGHHRRRLRRLTASRPVQVLLLLILILLAESVVRLYQRGQAVAGEEQSLKQELAALEARRAELTAEVASLETDRGGEAASRERFGVVKEGEKVINLVGVAPTGEATTTPVLWWRKILGGIGSVVEQLLPKQ